MQNKSDRHWFFSAFRIEEHSGGFGARRCILRFRSIQPSSFLELDENIISNNRTNKQHGRHFCLEPEELFTFMWPLEFHKYALSIKSITQQLAKLFNKKLIYTVYIF